MHEETLSAPESATLLEDLADAARGENPEALWRWLERVGSWEDREREAREARPDLPHLRRIVFGGREDDEWWWMSAVCSLHREWTAEDVRQIPPQVWAWPGLDGKIPELIYDVTDDRMLWSDMGAAIDARERRDYWLDKLEDEICRLRHPGR